MATVFVCMGAALLVALTALAVQLGAAVLARQRAETAADLPAALAGAAAVLRGPDLVCAAAIGARRERRGGRLVCGAGDRSAGVRRRQGRGGAGLRNGLGTRAPARWSRSPTGRDRQVRRADGATSQLWTGPELSRRFSRRRTEKHAGTPCRSSALSGEALRGKPSRWGTRKCSIQAGSRVSEPRIWSQWSYHRKWSAPSTRCTILPR